MFSSLRTTALRLKQIRFASLSAEKSHSADLQVVLLGQTQLDSLPDTVRAQVSRLEKSESSSSLAVATEKGMYYVIKPEPKEWLVGGEHWRVVGGRIASTVRDLGLKSAVLQLSDTAVATHIAEGVVLGDYKFTQFRSGKEATRQDITVHLPGQTTAIQSALNTATAQNFARNLADLPPNVLNPATFVARASELLKGLKNVTFSVIEGTDKLTKANFPGLVQVGKAGSTEPAMVEMHYRPPTGSPTVSPHKLALVGKGITFDSGGISIKPSDKMWEMKADMSGAAAVIAAFSLIAKEQPNIAVSAYLALAENLPSSKAQRPGDIYKARNGKFIHVDNTDAEGRLVLADVLTYACENGATHVVDAATLTGACMVALGERIAGLMGTDAGFVQTVRNSGQKVGEELWPLPLYGEYRESINHIHADVNNSAGSRYGGTITAGLFLEEFVSDKVKWAHLDIAGPTVGTSGWRYYGKGMTGFGTRTLAQIARDLAVA